MSKLGRTKADKLAGSPMPPCRPLPSYVSFSSSGKSASEWDSKEIEGLAPRTKTLKAPLFNMVDDNDTNLGGLTKVVSEVVGCEYSFVGTLKSQLAKLSLDSILQDANEHHLEPFAEMLEHSKPPITSTPLTPQMPADQLTSNEMILDGTKIVKIIGWKPKHPKLKPELVREALKLWKDQVEVWPNAPIRSHSD